jgi:hypothetical protein
MYVVSAKVVFYFIVSYTNVTDSTTRNQRWFFGYISYRKPWSCRIRKTVIIVENPTALKYKRTVRLVLPPVEFLRSFCTGFVTTPIFAFLETHKGWLRRSRLCSSTRSRACRSPSEANQASKEEKTPFRFVSQISLLFYLCNSLSYK